MKKKREESMIEQGRLVISKIRKKVKGLEESMAALVLLVFVLLTY